MAEEEIYDEASSSPLSKVAAMRQRLESSKPVLAAKPGTKLGGGGTLNVCAATPKIEKNNDSKPDKSENVVNGDVNRRNSKPVGIPAAFLKTASAQSPAEKPKLGLKPVQKATSDANNNPKNTANSEPPKVGVKDIGNMFEKPKTELFGPISPTDIKKGLKHVQKSPLEKTVGPQKIETKPGGIVDFRSQLKPTGVKLGAYGGVKPNIVKKPVNVVKREADGKKFQMVEKKTVNEKNDPVPEKPKKLDIEIDFDQLCQEFKKQVKYIEETAAEEPDELYDDVANVTKGRPSVSEEDQEEYDDVANVIRPKPVQRPVSNRIVSLIQPLSEEDEQQWHEAGFPGLIETNEDLPPPPPELIDESYDDAGVIGGAEEGDELYEPLPDDDMPPLSAEQPPSLAPKPPPKKSDKEAEKEDPAERKRREKEEKEAKARKEKEMKQKEKEVKKLLKDYKITAENLLKSVAKGIVKKSQKGGKLDVAVQEGDKVEIIRMVDNQKGKWLIRIDSSQKVGYCDANNIEVDTGMIRGVMESTHSSAEAPPVPPSPRKPSMPHEEETYEDVEGEGAIPDEPIEDEIYEVCN